MVLLTVVISNYNQSITGSSEQYLGGTPYLSQRDGGYISIFYGNASIELHRMHVCGPESFNGFEFFIIHSKRL